MMRGRGWNERRNGTGVFATQAGFAIRTGIMLIIGMNMGVQVRVKEGDSGEW